MKKKQHPRDLVSDLMDASAGLIREKNEKIEELESKLIESSRKILFLEYALLRASSHENTEG